MRIKEVRFETIEGSSYKLSTSVSIENEWGSCTKKNIRKEKNEVSSELQLIQLRRERKNKSWNGCDLMNRVGI